MRFLLISPVLFSRYKVGRIEQMESANQAKARGSNSVSVICIVTSPSFVLALSVVLILRPLASGGCKHHVSTLLDYAFPCLHVQNYMVIILERGTLFCFNVHRVMYTVILCPSILAETGNFVLLMTQFWHSGFNW